ncbi:efflux RND transporter periplasmic adaptor subunit [Undibacterium sp. TS12]|uniref:efflux RND transporter periplasmic adaptor subunit n=1 Tax=Undibacterium sp. TS12 TaxID=2908202 RepID=UPI001F4C623C|nr:efflux RND transporter periplasmic adaptor subunit [Undibacterium sp. TS12]MCH8619992.1 efflux RND transporter periplasmic adaptor subunit [Undibacterium sp. TS12]
MLKRRTFWIIAVVLLLAAGLVIMKKKSQGSVAQVPANTANSQQASQSAMPQVLEFLPGDIVEAGTADIRKLLAVSGALRAVNQAAVKAKVAGDITEVLVREGEAVQAGQVLVKMDSSDYLARQEQARGALAAAQGQLEIARQARDNNKALLDKSFISKNAYDNTNSQYAIAVANVDSAKAALAVAQKALADTVIRAPISGLVSSRMVQPGEKISPDNRLLDVVDLRVLEMEAPIPTQDISSIKIGQLVQLKIEGVTATVEGKVVRINPSTTTGSRSIMAYVQLANPDSVLRAGMFGEAQLVVEKKSDVLTVPETAIQFDAEQAFVYAIENNVLQQKPVKLGLRGESKGVAVVELQSGLAPRARIVKANLGRLRPGLAVKLITTTGKV